MVATGFDVHFRGGLFAVLAAGAIIFLIMGTPLWIGIAALGIFLVSSLLPDVDSPVSKPRRYLRSGLLIAGFVLVAVFYTYLERACPSIVGDGCGYLPVLALVLPFLGVEAVDFVIPGHRKFMHTFIAAGLYGVIVFLLLTQFRLQFNEAIFIGTFAALGYAFHLLIDFFGDRF